MTELPRACRVLSVESEGEGVSSLWLEGRIEYAPGQFVMVWLSREGEKPYAVSYREEDRFAITVKQRGPVSALLARIEPGARIGVRGPYGRGFDLREKGCIVAGSVGIATVAAIKDMYPAMPLLIGARTAAELMYAERFGDMRIFTDDGSAGTKGFPTDALPELLDGGDIEVVYTCGPEVMMAAVFRICEERNLECQASLERYMKCGFGICGQCACDGLLVCRDGPVFSSGVLRKLSDFGRTALRKDGRRVSIGEYAQPGRHPEPEPNDPVA